MCVYIYIYIHTYTHCLYTHIGFRGKHLSNTTCVKQAFFKRDEYCSNLC